MTQSDTYVPTPMLRTRITHTNGEVSNFLSIADLATTPKFWGSLQKHFRNALVAQGPIQSLEFIL